MCIFLFDKQLLAAATGGVKSFYIYRICDMAMAICHKSHMGGKTEEAGGFVLAQLELEFEYK